MKNDRESLQPRSAPRRSSPRFTVWLLASFSSWILVHAVDTYVIPMPRPRLLPVLVFATMNALFLPARVLPLACQIFAIGGWAVFWLWLIPAEIFSDGTGADAVAAVLFCVAMCFGGLRPLLRVGRLAAPECG
jgi:hypothetical protein